MIIKLYDYFDFWSYCWCGVGMGDNDAAHIGAQIDNAIRNKEDIEVHINSGGGYVYDGFNIYNALVAAKKEVKVKTVNMGIAASIASIVFMAGDEREMAKASLGMVHKPTIDPFYYGSMNADDLKREAAALDQIQAVLTSVYVEATGLDEGLINDMINAETWLTPVESELNGFCTSIIGSKDVKADVMEAVMNNIQRTAPENIKQYANRFFNTIKATPEKMNKELQDSLKESNTLMRAVKNAFNKAFPSKAIKNETLTLADGTTVYLDGALAVGVNVYTDEEMTEIVSDATHELSDGSTFTTVGGEVTEIAEAPAEDATNEVTEETIESLTARVAALETENLALTTENSSLKASNATALKNVQAANKLMKELTATASKYKAPEAGTSFSNSTSEESEKPKSRFINTKKKLKTT